MKAKITIEVEGYKDPIIFNADEINMTMEQDIKTDYINGCATHTPQDKHFSFKGTQFRNTHSLDEPVISGKSNIIDLLGD